jgi:PAS domain S-box-containing protein
MTSESGATDPQVSSVGGSPAEEDTTVLLFMQPGRDRELLAEDLGKRYQIVTSTDVAALDSSFDCCLFDNHEFNRVAGLIQPKRDAEQPVFLPFVLLVSADTTTDTAAAWEYVDEIIELPVEQRVLHARIENLVERRQTGIRLARREAQLEETVEDLKLKEQAMDEAPIGITIAEAQGADNPLIYVNEQFQQTTGYTTAILGNDCRFLQGENTDPETVAAIRAAIDAEDPIDTDILNYRADGQTFWNKLTVAPIRDEDTVTHYVGFQTDITERKIRERRLEVLNRVLNHNLRNKLSIIEGFTTVLDEQCEHDHAPLAKIERAADDLIGLAETAHKTERVLDAPDEAVIDIETRLVQLVDGFEEEYTTVEFDLTVPDDGCRVAMPGLVTAVEEGIENAAKHNDNDDPHVEITANRRADDWLDITIVDNGPGIPATEIDVLSSGETALQHGDRLGIWMMYWIVSKAGGEFEATEREAGGTELRLSVPLEHSAT